MGRKEQPEKEESSKAPPSSTPITSSGSTTVSPPVASGTGKDGPHTHCTAHMRLVPLWPAPQVRMDHVLTVLHT